MSELMLLLPLWAHILRQWDGFTVPDQIILAFLCQLQSRAASTSPFARNQVSLSQQSFLLPVLAQAALHHGAFPIPGPLPVL